MPSAVTWCVWASWDFAADTISLTRYELSQIELRTHLGSAGLLVVGGATHPGWRAYPDGKHIRLYEADGVLRAVALSARDSEVQFRYRPVTFYAGLAVSGATLLPVTGLGLARRAGKASVEPARLSMRRRHRRDVSLIPS